jgi:hypothetical protein
MEILKKIGRYFKNLFYTIIGKEVKFEDKEVEEEKIHGLFTENNVKRIIYLNEKLDGIKSDNLTESEREFIENRIKINHEKLMQRKYGKALNSPPEELKEAIEKDNDLDSLIMDRKMRGLNDISEEQ